MRKTTLSIAAFVLGFIFCAPQLATAASAGYGGFMIGLSGIKFDISTDGPTLGNSESSTTLYDVKAGYTMANSIYVGAIYDGRTDTTNGSKQERTGYGVTVGYHNSGWFIDGSYFISSSIKLAGGGELTGGSGFGVDLGHNFDMSSNIYIGLQVSYKSFSYAKVNGADQTNKIKSELTPMLNLGVTF